MENLLRKNPPQEEQDDGMLRMPVLEHLAELRTRILRCLYGFGVIFALCILASDRLFNFMMAPGWEAMRRTGIPGADFVALGMMEQFEIIYVWTPLVASLFLASPWILWQAWAFVSPGLYRNEKRWAAPFLWASSGQFILGGLFGYYIAFTNAMTFLLGIGKSVHVRPLISIEDYFHIFVDLMLGIGVAFELPVLPFLLTLIRVVSPRFLWSHANYAILAIVILAAVITPSTDAFNMALFAVPMIALFFLGLLASYGVVRKREGRWPFRGARSLNG